MTEFHVRVKIFLKTFIQSNFPKHLIKINNVRDMRTKHKLRKGVCKTIYSTYNDDVPHLIPYPHTVTDSYSVVLSLD